MVYELTDAIERQGRFREAEKRDPGRDETAGRLGQPTRTAEAPARAPGRCLTVVTTAKMTAIANANEKAAKTKRGTMLYAPLFE